VQWGWILFITLFMISPSYGVEFKSTYISDIKLNVKKATSLIDHWISDVNQIDYNLLCLGETHQDDFRFFYGEILKSIEFQSLALELKTPAFENLLKEWRLGSPLYLLNATFDPIAAAVDSKRAEIKIYAVEPTKQQNKQGLDQLTTTGKNEFSRDGFIAQNIVESFTRGEKMVALYGSLHCSINNQGVGKVPFANHLKNHWGLKSVLTVKLFNRDSLSTHPLISLVDSNKEFKRKTVVVSSQKLKPKMHNYNWKILSLTKNYDFIIIK